MWLVLTKIGVINSGATYHLSPHQHYFSSIILVVLEWEIMGHLRSLARALFAWRVQLVASWF